MVRRLITVGIAASGMLLGLAGFGGSGIAGASAPIPLVLDQSSAFAVLGHDCGSIGEHTFAAGFDAASGYPTGDVYLSTTCNGSGRGGHSITYSAWASATWDYTGATVSYAALSTAPTVNPTLTAFDAYGNEVYNQSNNAYLVLAPTFVPVPRVTSVSPGIGTASGGTSVTISGTGFTKATAVDFGSTAAASVVINSDTSITAVSPAFPPGGTVDITVTNAGGPSTTSSSDQFAFVAPPTISGLSPAHGPVTGGTAVMITGTNLTYVSSVTFGETGTYFTVNSATSITAVAPGYDAAEGVTVRVASLGGTSPRTPADVFTYQPTSGLSVTPKSGPAATPVGVAGFGFGAGETVKVTYRTGLPSPGPAWVAVCQATAASDGTFSCSGAIPSGATAGSTGAHTMKAKGSASFVTATTRFKLT